MPGITLPQRLADRIRRNDNSQPAEEPTQSDRPQAQENAQLEEAALIERARGDSAAFGELYERYVERIYAYIYRRVGNTQDAEDLTARTFYRALDRLETYEDRGLPFAAWLFRIAHNLVANWHRDHGRRRFIPIDKLFWRDSGGRSPEALVEEEERHDELWAAIERLPEDRQALLVHKFGSRLSNLEIGNLMNKSETAVKSLYFRTLAALRKDLETQGWDEDGEGERHE